MWRERILGTELPPCNNSMETYSLKESKAKIFHVIIISA